MIDNESTGEIKPYTVSALNINNIFCKQSYTVLEPLIIKHTENREREEGTLKFCSSRRGNAGCVRRNVHAMRFFISHVIC